MQYSSSKEHKTMDGACMHAVLQQQGMSRGSQGSMDAGVLWVIRAEHCTRPQSFAAGAMRMHTHTHTHHRGMQA